MIGPPRLRRVVLALRHALWGRALCSAAPPALASPQDKETAAFRSYVYTLAADSMEGRGLGTQGIRRSADWIEKRLRAIGLKPAFGKCYRQPFPVKMGVSLTPETGSKASRTAFGRRWASRARATSRASSRSWATESNRLRSAIRSSSGVDLKGKVALMLRYEPQEKDEASPFDGRRPSRWSAMRYKTLQARERGAVAVIFVTGPTTGRGSRTSSRLCATTGRRAPSGLPLLQVRTSVAQEWLSGAGIDLKQFQESVDRDLTPHSVASTHARVSGHVALENKFVDTANLAGVLPGRGALAGEVVVVGAHYDHLGMGGEHSMRPNEHAIHNGADDNASGCAGVLLAAESLKKSLQSSKNHRTVVFVLFSGEEVGLAGSAHFVAAPPFPIDRVTAMVNLDMVGRLRDDQLIALGSDVGPRVDGAGRARGEGDRPERQRARRRIRPVGPDEFLRGGDSGAPPLHRHARALPHARRQARDGERRGRREGGALHGRDRRRPGERAGQAGRLRATELGARDVGRQPRIRRRTSARFRITARWRPPREACCWPTSAPAAPRNGPASAAATGSWRSPERGSRTSTT